MKNFLILVIFTVCFFQNILCRADITTGLVGWWRFDDGSGTSAVDSSSGNTGTLQNSPTWVAGKIGSALSFNGSNQYINSFLSSFSPSGSSRTICVWINTNSSSRQGLVSTRNGGAAFGWSLDINRTTAGNITYINDSNVYELAGGITMGKLFDVCASYNVGTSTASIYVNGALIGSAAIGADSAAGYNGDIGRDNAGGTGTFYFNGIMDDVRIYNRALLASDVAQLYGLGGHTKKISNAHLANFHTKYY